MFRRLLCMASLLVVPAMSIAQEAGVHQTYRIEYRTVCQPQQVTAYRIQYETVYTTKKIIVQKPVTETKHYVRKYTVRKPVYKTSTRMQSYVTYKPQTVYREQVVDQGGWQTQTVQHPGRVCNRLTWMPGGCAVNPATGCTTHYRGGLAWVPYQTPGYTTARQVWKPNYVTHKIPYTQYVAHTDQKPVEVREVSYVDEPHEEKVAYNVCKMVNVEQEVQVPQCVQRRIPYTYTQYVQKIVAYRVPLDVCGVPTGAGSPIIQGESQKKQPTPAVEEKDKKSTEKTENKNLDKPQLPKE